MATYAIGDIQGCYKTLMRLLERIEFDARHDRIWLVGDLVNRGPDSLSVLRWAYSMGDRVQIVLGNHDIFLLALWSKVIVKKAPNLELILKAPDVDQLLEWLRHQPLIYQEKNVIMAHSGILPAWSSTQAHALAQEVQTVLRGDKWTKLLAAYFTTLKKNQWSDNLEGNERLSTILAAFTLMRTCKSANEMDLDFSGELTDIPKGLTPWFRVPGRQIQNETVVFGHWAALGLYQASGVVGIDTGCVWGGSLTAWRLEDGEIFSEPSIEF